MTVLRLETYFPQFLSSSFLFPDCFGSASNAEIPAVTLPMTSPPCAAGSTIVLSSISNPDSHFNITGHRRTLSAAFLNVGKIRFTTNIIWHSETEI